MNNTTTEREAFKAKNLRTVPLLPDAGVIISMLEHIGFKVATGYQSGPTPVLEERIDLELETIFPHYHGHEVLYKVQRWLRTGIR